MFIVGVFIVGLVKVLFVNVSVPVRVTKLSSDNAVLNSATVPDSGLVVKLILLFVNVTVLPDVATRLPSILTFPAEALVIVVSEA